MAITTMFKTVLCERAYCFYENRNKAKYLFVALKSSTKTLHELSNFDFRGMLCIFSRLTDRMFSSHFSLLKTVRQGCLFMLHTYIWE